MDDRKLIREVSQHRFLFDKCDEAYRDGIKKEFQWQSIGEILNISGHSAFRRWRDLRDRYVKERKKEVQSRISATGFTYKSKWCLMEHLQFLQETIKHRDNFNISGLGKNREEIHDPTWEDGRIRECYNTSKQSKETLEGRSISYNLRGRKPTGTTEKTTNSELLMHHSVISALQSDSLPPWLSVPSSKVGLEVPDLSERIGMEGSPMTSKMESGSSYLTCSPLLSGMPGIHEDPMPVAGPSSSSHDQQEEILPPEYDQEEIEVKSEPIFRASSEICEDDNSQNNTQSSSDRPSSHSSPTSGMTGPYLLKKETHCSTILDQLLRDDTFSDVTLTAEGQSIKAHKIVLCLASAYFRQVLSKESSVQNVIVFRDIKFSELRNLINFIYTGEATVDAAELESFMRTAEMLEVNSLCEGHRTLPKNLIPKSKEAEPEKTKLSSGSSKRSHSSMVASPPMKTRRIVSTDSSPSSKISKVATYPSTSTEGGSVPPPTTSSATYPTCVIKSEPPSDEGEEREFCPRVDENKGLPETSMESPRHYEEPDQSPPLDRIDDLPEKVPLGKCPFCPNPQQQPSLFGSSLTNHVHLCHPEKTAFPCDICSRVFLKKRSFEAHKEDCVR